ncbi:fibronectin type III domain-containing protein [Pilimelia anulata]|uniref:fibronectin type III domain-containing protein n=1 Tax=Pilimelia anulata TaxID=53371 RepID=UPI001667AE15|nr:fibronectin type III domain-containing protein [Pilimelia anulata]
MAREPGAVVLTWADPSGGRATYVVTGGQAGGELRLLAQLPAGSPARYTAAGFRPGVAYCFQVSAVYSTSEFGVAPPVCTDRE